LLRLNPTNPVLFQLGTRSGRCGQQLRHVGSDYGKSKNAAHISTESPPTSNRIRCPHRMESGAHIDRNTQAMAVEQFQLSFLACGIHYRCTAPKITAGAENSTAVAAALIGCRIIQGSKSWHKLETLHQDATSKRTASVGSGEGPCSQGESTSPSCVSK
jgi:hypothetical protein